MLEALSLIKEKSKNSLSGCAIKMNCLFDYSDNQSHRDDTFNQININRTWYLYTVHALKTLLSWSHNRYNVIQKFGPEFSTVVVENIRALVIKLEDLIIKWSDIPAHLDEKKSQLIHNTKFILSAITGLVQISSLLGDKTDKNAFAPLSSVAGVQPPPLTVSTVLEYEIDLFLEHLDIPSMLKKTSQVKDTEATFSAEAYAAPLFELEDKLTNIVTQQSTSTRNFKSYLFESSQDTENEQMEKVHILVTTLRKLLHFSRLFSPITVPTVQSSLSNNALPGIASNILKFILMSQNELLYSLSTIVASNVNNLRSFRLCEGVNTVQSLLRLPELLPSANSSDIIELGSVQEKLLFHRCLLVFRCQASCMHNYTQNLKQGSDDNMLLKELDTLFNSLGTLMSWLMRNIHHDIKRKFHMEEAELVNLSIICKCPLKLHVKLPGTDLYPWEEDQAGAGLLRGMMTSTHGRYCHPSFSSLFNPFSQIRENFFPIDVSHVFEPTKSYIYSMMDKVDINSAEDIYNTEKTKKDLLWATYMEFQGCKLLNHLFDTLFDFTWKFFDLGITGTDGMIVFKLVTRVSIRTLDSFPEAESSALFFLCFLFFISRCMKRSPMLTRRASWNEQLFKSLLKLGRLCTVASSPLASAPKRRQSLRRNNFFQFVTKSGSLDATEGLLTQDQQKYEVCWRYGERDEKTPEPDGGVAGSPLTAVNGPYLRKQTSVEQQNLATLRRSRSFSPTSHQSEFLETVDENELKLKPPVIPFPAEMAKGDPTPPPLPPSVEIEDSMNSNAPTYSLSIETLRQLQIGTGEEAAQTGLSFPTISAPSTPKLGIATPNLVDPEVTQSTQETSRVKGAGSQSPSKADGVDEYLRLFVHVLVKDFVLELLWISSTFGNLSFITSDNLAGNIYRQDEEATAIVESLSFYRSDDSLVLLLRWLINMVSFQSRLGINCQLWPTMLRKSISVTKYLLDYLHGGIMASETMVQQRPFYWPARAAAILLVTRIMFCSGKCKWLDIFIPTPTGSNNTGNSGKASDIGGSEKKSSLQSKSNSNIMDRDSEDVSGRLPPRSNRTFNSMPTIQRNNFEKETPGRNIPGNVRILRHTILLRLLLDPLCRTYAVCVCLKILHSCALEIQELGAAEPVDKKDLSKSSAWDRRKLCEALAHDVIKGFFNVIKNVGSSMQVPRSRSPSSEFLSLQPPHQTLLTVQPAQNLTIDFSEAFETVVVIFKGLCVFLRNPMVLQDRDQQGTGPISLLPFLDLFTKYGPLTPSNEFFAWTHSRTNVFRDLLLSLDTSLQRLSRFWSGPQKSLVINYALTFINALMLDHDRHKELFWQLMMQKNRRRPTSGSSSVLPLVMSATSYNYHELFSLVLAGFDSVSVEPDTVLVLFDILMDGLPAVFRERLKERMRRDTFVSFLTDELFTNSVDPPTIWNLTAVPLILNLLCYSNEVIQGCILEFLLYLLGGNGGNSSTLINLSKSVVIQPPLLEMLLDVFPLLGEKTQKIAVNLLQVTGKHSITVAQLKRIFRLLQSQNQRRAPSCCNLLDAMDGMTQQTDGPKSYFFFQGQDSGLRLPSFKKWPATSGYTFSTWFRINHPNFFSRRADTVRDSYMATGSARFRPSVAEMRYHPRLLCFRQESGMGFEIYFKEVSAREPDHFTIMMSVYTSSGKATVQIGTVAADSHKSSRFAWHHIALSHTASGLRTKSELLALIDGEASKHTISYPRFSEEVKGPTIGDTAPHLRDEHINTAFFGQVGAMYFLSESVSEAHLTGIFELGPGYSQLFSERDGRHRRGGTENTENVSKALDGSLLSLIMLNYNPEVRSGNFVTDNSPERNVHRWKVTGFDDDLVRNHGGEKLSGSSKGGAENATHAFILPGTYICSTRDMRDSLDCLGGIKVLLPLFTQLVDPPGELNNTSNFAESTSVGEVFFNKLINLFFSFLRGTPENARLFNGVGFTVMAHLLDQIGPKFMTVEAVESLLRHCKVLEWNQPWQDELIKQILCNFKFWVFTSAKVQENLFSALRQFAHAAPDRFLRLLPARKLIDALYLLYSSKAQQQMRDTAARSDEMAHYKRWVSFYSLTEKELRNIRQSIFQLLYLMFSSTTQSLDEELCILVQYFSHENSPFYKIEVLQLLLQLLNQEKVELAKKVLSGLCRKKLLFNILSQHSNPRAKVRLYALVVTCSIIQLSVLHGKLPSEKTPVTALGQSSSTVPGSKQNAAPPEDYSESFGSFDDSSSRKSNRASTSKSAATTDTLGISANVQNQENEDTTSSDIFSALGIPVKALSSMFLWVQQQLIEQMRKRLFDVDSFDRQCFIIFTALKLTMHGRSCKFLLVEIEKISMSSGAEEESTPGKEEESPLSPSGNSENSNFDDSVELDTGTAKICFPMVIPALIDFFRHDIVSTSLRIQFVLKLKHCIHGAENFDTFISVPGWQTGLLQILALEQRRIQLLQETVDSFSRGDPNEINELLTKVLGLSEAAGGRDSQRLSTLEKEVEDSKKIYDIVIKLITEIQLHSIRFGVSRVSQFVVSRPAEYVVQDYYRMPMVDILSRMKKESREIGCSVVLREAMSCLRALAMEGYLDGQTTGIDILQRLVEAVQNENNTILAENEDLSRVRRRMMDVNMWIMTTLVLEFIMMPPPQPARSSRESKTLTDEDVREVFMSPRNKALMKERADVGSTEKVGQGVRSRHQSFSLVGYSEKTIRSELPGKADRSDEDIFSFLSDSCKVSSADTNDESAGGMTPELSFRNQSYRASRIPNIEYFPQSMTPKKRAQLGKNSILSDHVWELLESLLDLLGPVGASDSWFRVENMERIKIIATVGVRLGRYMNIACMDSLDAVAGQNYTKAKTGNQTTLVKAIDSVVWLLTRLLLSIFTQGGAEKVEQDEDSSSLKASVRLMSYLDWMRESSKDEFLQESVLVVVKLSQALRLTRQASGSRWTRRSLEIMKTLLNHNKTYLSEIVTNFSIQEETSSPVSSPTPGVRESFSYTSPQPKPISTNESVEEQLVAEEAVRTGLRRSDTSSTAETDDSLSSDSGVKSKNNLLIYPPESGLKRTGSMGAGTPLPKAAAETLAILKEELQLPPTVDFTWNIWLNATEHVLSTAQKRETELMASKLNEMGQHKDSDHVIRNLNLRSKQEAQFNSVIETKVRDTSVRSHVLESKHLRESIRLEKALGEEVEGHWKGIMDELTNERAPWGCGAYHSSDNQWLVDPAENSSRMKPKLRRGMFKVDYLNKFLQSNTNSSNQETPRVSSVDVPLVISESSGSLGKFSPPPPTVTFAMGDDSAEASQDVTNSNESSNLTGLGRLARRSSSDVFEGSLNPSLWKDLLKFQPDSTADILGEESDEEEEGDDKKEPGSTADLPAAPTPTIASSRITSMTFSKSVGVVSDSNKILFSATCEVVLPSSNSVNPPAYGTLEVTRNSVTFTRSGDGQNTMFPYSQYRAKRVELSACDELWACQPFPSHEWHTDQIWRVLCRYYQQRFVAIELYTTDRKVHFFNFFEVQVAKRFQMVIRKIVKPPHMAPHYGTRPFKIIQRIVVAGSSNLSLTAAWANREISNFEYLMQLNSIAGRTYNDLGQYPVFPWVLSDYSSSELDLKNPASFRDFRWPVGAQDPKQRAMIAAKYADLQSMYEMMKDCGEDAAGAAMPPFHYGTHYSVAGFVLWFLMRLEPYTSLHVQLQDGRIDRPDRLFDSFEAAWKGCTSNPSDVKELVPELFYNPEILCNVNSVDFGTTQVHKKVGDIVLPPWAKDPHDFIFKHREALESEFVSLNLHHWIDLVFGYKQRPPHLNGDQAAVDSCNVFFHLTYAGAVDLETLRTSNRGLYEQYVCQITEFGQTPSQLFFKPHASRVPLKQVDIIWPIASIVHGVQTIANPADMPVVPRKIISFKEYRVSVWPIVLIVESADRLITVDSSRTCAYHHWQVQSPDVVPPFKFKLDQTAYELSRGQGSLQSLLRFSSTGGGRERRVGVPFAPSHLMSTTAASTSCSPFHNGASAPAATTPTVTRRSSTGGTQQPLWRPVKVRAYEKDERERTRRTHYHGGNPGIRPISGHFTFNDSGDSNSRQNSVSGDPSSSRPLPLIPAMTPENDDHSVLDSAASTPRASSMMSTREDTTPRTRERNVTNGHISLQKQTPRNSAYVTSEYLKSQLFAFLPDARILFSCGHWDYSFRATVLESGKLLQCIRQHSDVVTCMALGKDFGSHWLVTGSRDCTLMVWEVVADREALPITVNPLFTLYGHDDAVTSVAVNVELDVVVSGSDDGTVIVHNLRDGSYVRSVVDPSLKIPVSNTPPEVWSGSAGKSSAGHPDERMRSWSLINKSGDSVKGLNQTLSSHNSYMNFHDEGIRRNLSGSLTEPLTPSSITSSGSHSGPVQRKISWVGISKLGYIITYSAEDQVLTTFSINGRPICCRGVPEALYTFLLSDDGRVIVTGGSSCLVVFRWVHTLELAHDGPRQGFEAVLDGSMQESGHGPFDSPIRALHLTKLERHLIVGLESGELRILAQDSAYLRQRLQRKLIEIGIL